MGQYFHYVNFSLRQVFSAAAFDQNIKEGGVGVFLQGMALALLLCEGCRREHHLVGLWTGDDEIGVIGDDTQTDYDFDEFSDFENINDEVLEMIAVCRPDMLREWLAITDRTFFKERAKPNSALASLLAQVES